MLSRLTLSLLTLYITTITSYITFNNGVSIIKKAPRHHLRQPRQPYTVNAMTEVNTPKSQLPQSQLPQSQLPQIAQPLSNANISSIIKNTGSYLIHNIPFTEEGDQLNISSIYLNIDKVNGVYFAKDVNNVIFTLPDKLTDLYYYNKNDGVIYKVSNKTRINMKSLQRFVFQSFNNNADGVLF